VDEPVNRVVLDPARPTDGKQFPGIIQQRNAANGETRETEPAHGCIKKLCEVFERCSVE
jgi:hypothetical protein